VYTIPNREIIFAIPEPLKKRRVIVEAGGDKNGSKFEAFHPD
jgi:hypothetical protein